MTNLEYSRGWLRAIVDGEGCIICKPRQNLIDIANTEPEIIRNTKAHLRRFDISYNCYRWVHAPPRKPIFHLRITGRDNIVRFAREIGSGVPYKRAALKRMVAWYNRPGQRRNRWYGPTTPDRNTMLSLKREGLTRDEMAERLGVSFYSIQYYMTKHGLVGSRRTGAEPSVDAVKRLYWDDGLGLDAVSAFYGYKGKSIVRFMERNGISRRPVGRREGVHLNSS